jgi:hypothetical protein
MFGTSFLSRLNVRLRIPFKYHSEERSDEESIFLIAAMRKTHIYHLERNGSSFISATTKKHFSPLARMTVTPVSVWGTVAESTDPSLCSG